MNPVLLGLLSGILGLAVGVFGVVAYISSQRHRRDLAEVDEPALSEGAAEILGVLGRAYIVVDGIDGVVRASPGAYAFGLVRGHTLMQEEVLELTARVRRDGVIEERNVELNRGLMGQGSLILQLRVAPIAEEYILILADDRTEATRTEEMRNDFVANVSHELKTPVGAISLLAEAIDDAAASAGRNPAAVRRLLNISGSFEPAGRGLLQGPVTQWVEEITEMALLHGISGFILASDDAGAITRFGAEVAPAVRQLVAGARAGAA